MRLGPPAQASEQERALREFTCTLCKGVLVDPLSTPCGHHFCKPCLEARYAVSLTPDLQGPPARPQKSLLPR